MTLSYGHAEALARAAEAAETDRIAKLCNDPDVRRILAERDIGALYQAINATGVPQRRIAELTGQAQSEVSEILDGRKVLSYDLLVRIAKGLSIPRELMGLSFGAYSEEVTVADPKGVVEVLRRRLIELGAGLAVSAPAAKLAPLLDRLELPDPPPVPLPTRLSGVHVSKVRDLTRRAYGSDPEVSSAAAAWASRLLDVSGPEAVRKALFVAVAELHIEAGWGAFDAGLYDRAMHHYGCALKLATEADDAYCQALALNFAGLATVEHGQPDNGLKLLQVGTVTALGIPDGEEQRLVVVGGNGRSAVQACAGADSATALADLDEPEKANTALAKSRELWQPTPADPGGELDRPAACLELDRGRLDMAEQFAAASVRRWEGSGKRGYIHSCVVLATVYVRAGEPRGLQLAHSAISAADKTSSGRVRRRMVPLAAALEARSNSDAQQLARMARQVAATRA